MIITAGPARKQVSRIRTAPLGEPVIKRLPGRFCQFKVYSAASLPLNDARALSNPIRSLDVADLQAQMASLDNFVSPFKGRQDDRICHRSVWGRRISVEQPSNPCSHISRHASWYCSVKPLNRLRLPKCLRDAVTRMVGPREIMLRH